MKDLITKLQNKPYETRVKILWATVLVAGVLLIIIWIFGLKGTLSNLDTKDLVKLDTTTSTTAAATNFANVERVEQTEKVLKIYFNFNNTSDNILNVSQLSDIQLTVNGKTSNPQAITDRQNNPFVKKVLSHTQNFGILTFSPSNDNKASLTFDQMFLESNPAAILQQKLELDLNQLSKPSNLRN